MVKNKKIWALLCTHILTNIVYLLSFLITAWIRKSLTAENERVGAHCYAEALRRPNAFWEVLQRIPAQLAQIGSHYCYIDILLPGAVHQNNIWKPSSGKQFERVFSSTLEIYLGLFNDNKSASNFHFGPTCNKTTFIIQLIYIIPPLERGGDGVFPKGRGWTQASFWTIYIWKVLIGGVR